jgi:hypothetical protein
MSLIRAPRKILTSWVDNPRLLGCPQMTWGRTLKRLFINLVCSCGSR